MSVSLQNELNELFSALHQQRIITYASAAALTWVGYDILLTVSQEVKVVWRGKPSLAKLFYLIARYYSFVMLAITVAVSTNTGDLNENLYVPASGLWHEKNTLRPYSCKGWIKVYASVPIAVSYAVDALLIIRLYALYNKSKIRGLATASTFAVISLRGTQFITKPFHLPYPGCIVTIPVQIDKTIASWTISLFTQLVFFALILYKFVISISTFITRDQNTSSGEEISKRGIVIQALRQTRKLAPLFSLFVRDGTFAFLVIFAVVLLNLVFAVAVNSGPIEQMGTPCLLAADAVLASRLVLNLGGYLDGSPVITNSSGTYNVHRRASGFSNLGDLQFAGGEARSGETTNITSTGHGNFPRLGLDAEMNGLDSHARV